MTSSRGTSAASTPSVPYLDKYIQSLQDLCDPISNRNGYIALCVAENKLVQDELSKRYLEPNMLKAAFGEPYVYCYNDFLGVPVAREAVARFLTRKFLRLNENISTSTTTSTTTSTNLDSSNSPQDEEAHLETISSNNIAFGSGCASLLNVIFFTFAEEGDAVLIPAPYYAAFETDMSLFAKCIPIAVMQQDPQRGPTVDELESAAIEAEKQGLRVKILLLTNPNNPLGIIYKPAVITDVVSWARQRKLHTIMDEIYALSEHKQTNHHFQSILRILNNQLSDDVHMVWALSKDFGSSGLRIGFLVTQNVTLLEVVANVNCFSVPAIPMQLMVAELLSDDAFIDSFLQKSASRLLKSYTMCTTKLQEMYIPFVPAEAGIFIYCDFSSLLQCHTFESERRFASLLFDIGRIIMTPGETQRESKPGLFRICYAWVSVDVLEIALNRIQFLVELIRKVGWEDLDPCKISIHDVMQM